MAKVSLDGLHEVLASLDLDSIQAEIRSVAQREAKLQRELVEVRKRRSELLAVLQLIAPAKSQNGRLVGQAAICRVLSDGNARSVTDIHGELEANGWVNPDAMHPKKATETAINRLYEQGQVERVSRGMYRLVT